MVWQTAPADRICSHSGIGIADHDGRAEEAMALHVETLREGLGFGLEDRGGQQIAHAAPGIALEHDEAPGKELAVVRDPGGRRKNGVDLRRRRPRAGHGFCRTGAARQQQIERAGRGAIEGGGCGIHC
jgi:hypothetical protein